MYSFNYLENEIDINCQILIYNSTKSYYKELIKDLEDIFEEFKIEEETIEEKKLERLVNKVVNTYFDRYMIPSFNERDIENLLKYYAQKAIEPTYYSLEELDRNRLNVETIAKKIVEENMGRIEESAYIKGLWENEEILKIYFNKFNYFHNQVETEIKKIIDILDYEKEENIEFEKRNIEEMSLYEIGKHYPIKEIEIRDLIFKENQDQYKGNTYTCVQCRFQDNNRGKFHIDHIKPLSKGGLTVKENLQVLCKSCNMIKSDAYEV